jgi:molecular chaperone DnaK
MATIGIDLGTTNSVVAVCEAGRPRVIANEEGQRVTPSVVGFVDDGNVVVGSAAKRQATTNAGRTVVSVKRLMGRRFEEVEPGNAGPPLVADASGGVGLSIDGRLVSPQFVSSRILSKLKRAAENALGEAVDAAVITVPAYFDDAQRQATRQAAEIAGLEVRRLVNEPTAAALALATESPEPVSGRIVVYDLGGGTFDVSVLDISDGVVEVIATSGDTRLGGDDMDQRVVDALADRFASEQGLDLRADRGAMQRLRDAAERAKRDLGVSSRTEIHVPFITNGPDGPLHLHAVVTRAEFERLVADLVGRRECPSSRSAWRGCSVARR